jgi:hypothetical protein
MATGLRVEDRLESFDLEIRVQTGAATTFS